MNNKYKGIIYIILSAFFFALMNSCVRLSGNLPSIQKSFFRNFVAFFIAVFIILKNKEGFNFKKENIKYFILRSVFGTLGIFCNFYAIDKLVLSDASMLNKMSPFFAIIFSYFFLKEKINTFQICAVISAFIGSLFIIKPTFSNIDIIPAAIGLLGGIGAGAAYTFVRILGQKGENKSFIVLFFSGFSCLCSLPFTIFNFVPMTLNQVIILLGAGFFAALGQFTITTAYCYAPAKEISVYDYSQVIFAAIIGYFLFEQIPDIYSILGYIIICLTAIIVFIYNKKIDLKKQV